MNLGIETETLEFKKSTGELKEAMNSICAILNKHQKGELYFGVKPDGTPIGQIVTEESLREVSQKIGNSIEPKIYPEVKKVTIDDRDCIYVQFEGNNVPYFAFGVAKIRVADEDLTMSPKE
ncbi:MAG: ATP-binding protein, partial [Lachnospira sp.]|nr:ATP-binding protein [Lachnospira sp.]